MDRLLRFVTLSLFLASVAVTGARQQYPDQQQHPLFRGSSDTVRVFVTVTDRDGRLVTSLTKDQFEARDNGKSQPITVFDNSAQPIQLIVLLDVSGSMSGNLNLLRSGAMHLFGELAHGDLVRIGTFGNEIEFSPAFTNDIDALTAALPDYIPTNAPTPLWRAINKAIDVFDDTTGLRKVVLVLSDGKNEDIQFSWRSVSQGDVIDRATADDVMVYAVGLHSSHRPTNFTYGPPGYRYGYGSPRADMPDPGLAKTAEQTGGGYAEVQARDDLGAAFAEIAQELHSQYLLGYEPPKRDGKTHKIEVRVSRGGMTPRARKSYVAPKETK